MNVLDFDYDLNAGFVWMIIDGKREGSQLTVQCCLERRDEKFIKSIKRSDCGHDWGICGDVNHDAFKYLGEVACMSALFEEAVKAHFTLV